MCSHETDSHAECHVKFSQLICSKIILQIAQINSAAGQSSRQPTKKSSDDILFRQYAVRLDHNEVSQSFKHHLLAIPQPSGYFLQSNGKPNGDIISLYPLQLEDSQPFLAPVTLVLTALRMINGSVPRMQFTRGRCCGSCKLGRACACT